MRYYKCHICGNFKDCQFVTLVKFKERLHNIPLCADCYKESRNNSWLVNRPVYAEDCMLNFA